ncbi:unnamed protein product [Rotaria sordida]|uniref:Peptidase S1 domain-containing protein n=1 Tax=Rotaria sordida TaxID=392033 RepID=A0A813Q4J2_9BILA|nr:unnamed protein product [Rotaria sordida]CAF0861590.1 unnamed protein product [Rotaria sordida]CAF0871430.1 unnamed protein product [Rotaria sordida]
MLFWIIVTALLCSSTIRANPSISFFFPQNLTVSTCTGSNSWTKWFNSAKPSDNGNFDRELLSVIGAANGRDVCATSQGVHVQSVGQLPGTGPFGGSWSTTNNVISGFQSSTAGLDFQIRFCCANSDFTPTTTTTTTARPMPSSTCGRAEIQHSLKSSRIFGGSHAVRNSWPWQVLYEERKSCGNNQICLGVCGGTLIDSRHVLTAAHCIGTTNPTAITITAGLHNKKNDESDTRQVRAVERIFMHPNYNDKTIENDLTILRLAQPVQFNKYVQPACLPGPEPQPDADVILIGWGALQMGTGAYHELKQTKVKVIGDCNKYWGQVNEEKQVCVGHTGTGDSACQGDSGGPMLYERNGQWIVSGVASFVSATGCTTYANSRPNVYARVSAYLPWIKSII